uniref:Uncharacterized protein n=1 Tax=viral metagenome TaxID=1070528 RepID=A0A6C0LBE7_9ZZZZ
MYGGSVSIKSTEPSRIVDKYSKPSMFLISKTSELSAIISISISIIINSIINIKENQFLIPPIYFQILHNQ